MRKSRMLRSALAIGLVSLLGACAVVPPYGGPPYGGPPYDTPPVVIVDPCGDFILGCGRGHEPEHGRPPGPDHGRPDPDRGGHEPDHGPGQARPPAPRPQPPAPRPVHHDEEEQPAKH